MQILIVRHAIAEERTAFAVTGKSDALRPLTPRGIERMRAGARGLHRIQPELDLLITSPYTRARQTADILAGAYPGADRKTWEELSAGAGSMQIAERLRTLPTDVAVALVGHEPDLSELIGRLTGGREKSCLRLKKGAACLLETYGAPAPGNAELLWALLPRHLRQLGKA